ncbi:(2Fe-2S)-binding protein [Megalodesulfovibrio gigas]|uniref:Putative Carbon-monoxide dehydrogenase (Acceptor) n=1 Tax=Megalodesulfovibrio gigas (strain ATCC 19364 / DSM 1382 / NCIMB 9332 / VKM B-1759) TaxID=1121448 RepID=T2GDG0_MEGG1|nr:(2Fe-2S)-binding protein [Megalodesulfovibrio gigas]AGW14209.1 putative Carbon-monoxide dehydrogenase (acceptor) [Megalodesulfovibrio gigas DSM 1382 = ATCC 19364]
MTAIMPISFLLNGRPVRLDVAPGRRALDVLREDLGLIATREGCGSGECGACTVLVDGETRLSCLMLAVQLDGRKVTTAEGLGSPASPHPLQTAFAEHGAVQCGYCSPGMTLAAAALLARNPSPCRAEVREALAGNLCRCTGYVKIVDAVMAAAETMRDEDDRP